MNSSVKLADSSSAAATSPADLSDSELLVATRLLVGRSNQLLAALLVHLAEVEARGVHRTRACLSLYAYCIYELRFSEDEAYRRVTAARLMRRFPPLRDAIATGELHLTGLLMLGPYLTEQNLAEVLARAKHRTKKEIARLVRWLDPLPDVPPRIEPLGPPRSSPVPKTPTWSTFVQSMAAVRELQPGDRPRDWMTSEPENAKATANVNVDVDASANANVDTSADALAEPAKNAEEPEQNAEKPAQAATEPEQPTPAPARLTPQRYAVQFTANEEYIKLVEEAKALLSHSDPRLALDELHLRAMRAFVAELERRKYAVPKRPRKPTPDSAQLESAPKSAEREPASDSAGWESGPNSAELESAPTRKEEPAVPRRRGRYIPARVRRAVFERDEGRCTFVDSSGERCRETHQLEFHHVHAFARGGASTEQNLTLRCRAHNALAAEDDFGKEFVEAARSSPHEPWPK